MDTVHDGDGVASSWAPVLQACRTAPGSWPYPTSGMASTCVRRTNKIRIARDRGRCGLDARRLSALQLF